MSENSVKTSFPSPPPRLSVLGLWSPLTCLKNIKIETEERGSSWEGHFRIKLLWAPSTPAGREGYPFTSALVGGREFQGYSYCLNMVSMVGEYSGLGADCVWQIQRWKSGLSLYSSGIARRVLGWQGGVLCLFPRVVSFRVLSSRLCLRKWWTPRASRRRAWRRSRK